MTQESPMLEFKNVSKIYHGNQAAIENINLKIDQGDFVCLIGTSGSGKTTTMRMINRMLDPTSGQIFFKGQNLKKYDPVKLRRQIGYVIQNIGLIPHMNIYQNITIVPKLLNWPENKKRKQAQELIKLVELPNAYLTRYPGELSGGQQQRIGVIRALAAKQDLILMDEPFGALDPITRQSLQDLVKQLQEKLGKTVVFVTHDMDEALKLATKIVVMDQGHIIQATSPTDLLRHPANDFVRKLIGEERLLQAKADITTAQQIMLTDPVAITADQPLKQAVQLMKKRRVDTLLVTDNENRLKGYLDLAELDIKYSRSATVGQLMRTKFLTIYTDSLIRNSVDQILKEDVKYAPVIDHAGKLQGIVTRSSLVDLVYDIIWGNKEDDAPEKSTATVNKGGER
jgi:osmoprotectant transport system ATP-binding protein